MKTELKIAIVGCGSMAFGVHMPCIQKYISEYGGVTIAGCADINAERAKNFAGHFGVPASFEDYRRMLDEVKPDAVVCLVSEPYISAVSCEVLRRGINTILSRERGPIVHSICKFYKYYPYAYTAVRDHMYDDCIHAIDTVRWMNGGECIGIQSKMKSVGVPDLNFITAILTFDNGSTGIVINSWSSGKRIFAVEMHAPGIYVEAEHEDRAYVWKDGNLTPEIYKTEEVAGSDKYFISSGVQLKARNFVDCCRSKQLCDSAFQDAIKTVRIAEKILAENTLENE